MWIRGWSAFFRFVSPAGFLILFVLMTSGCLEMQPRAGRLGKMDGPPGFSGDIRRIMARFCFDCHGGKHREAGLDLRNLRVILAGGESGPAIVPGDPEKSILFTMMYDGHMPPEGKKPGLYQIEQVRRWIESGACP